MPSLLIFFGLGPFIKYVAWHKYIAKDSKCDSLDLESNLSRVIVDKLKLAQALILR